MPWRSPYIPQVASRNDCEFPVALGPLFVHPLSLCVKVSTKLRQLLGDALDPMFEARSRQVAIDLLSLRCLPFTGSAHSRKVNEADAKSVGDRNDTSNARYPDPIDLTEMSHVLWHCL
jgi:hypothetical protein